MLASPGAIAIDTNHFTIYWYGIIMASAFLLGQIIVFLSAKLLYKEDKDIVNILVDLAFWALLGGILGARFYYVLLNIGYYIHKPLEVLAVQNGGLSIHGALFGGIIATFIYSKRTNKDFLKFADLYAFGLPLAQALGRWGNFFNSEAFGLPTILPWGMYIPDALRPSVYRMYEYFHPTFLYECIWDIFIFLVLFFIVKKFFFDKKGVLFFSYLILYSVGRIAIECIRVDSVLNIFGVPVAIWVCVITIIIATLLLFKIKKHKNV